MDLGSFDTSEDKLATFERCLVTLNHSIMLGKQHC